MNINKPKLVALITHPIQYYAPLYKKLSERNNIDIHVIFLSDAGTVAYHDPGFGKEIVWDIPLLEGYPYTILEQGLNLEKVGFWTRYSPKLLPLLDQLSPDFIMVYGYASKMNWVAQRWAIQNNKKFIYTSDSNFNNSKNYLKNFLKRIAVSKFFKNVTIFLSPSEANERYLIHFGAQKQRIVRSPFAIEFERWSSASSPCLPSKDFQFVWAGKFVDIKRPLDFIFALHLITGSTGIEIDALIIGDGPLKGQIKDAIRALPASCRVKMAGFVNQKNMPRELARSEIFVFSSDVEAYGLIASEAAAAGLALIVADKIGCVGDTVLARPGVNALTYPAGDVEALSKAMSKLIDEPQTRSVMQHESLEIAKGHDISVAAKIIEDVVLKNYVLRSSWSSLQRRVF